MSEFNDGAIAKAGCEWQQALGRGTAVRRGCVVTVPVQKALFHGHEPLVGADNSRRALKEGRTIGFRSRVGVGCVGSIASVVVIDDNIAHSWERTMEGHALVVAEIH